jgi:hypothetical protein
MTPKATPDATKIGLEPISAAQSGSLTNLHFGAR